LSTRNEWERRAAEDPHAETATRLAPARAPPRVMGRAGERGSTLPGDGLEATKEIRGFGLGCQGAGLLGSAGDGGGQERPSAMPHPPSRRPWRRGGRANGGLVSHVRLGGRVARAAKTQRCGGGEGRGEDDVSFFSWRK
jgi:hypothetical protein